MKEIFKPLLGYEGLYEISNKGEVLSIKSGKLIKKYKNQKGYFLVSLYNNGSKTRLLSRLVAINFIPNPLKLPQVNHIDGIKTNNRVDNLEWISDSDNKKHAYKNNLHNVRGERNPLSKLTNEQILEIREFYKDTAPGRLKKGVGKLKEMAEKYNVSMTLISYIRNNKFWTHIK